LLAKAAKQLGEAQFAIALAFDDDVLKEVTERLRVIFGERFKATAKKKKDAPAPKQDYSTIRYLDLEGKNLQELPAYVQEMTAVETARLARNPKLDFGKVCEVLAALPALRELTFTTTQVPAPKSIGRLRALEILQLDGFTEPQAFPETFAELTQLRELRIMSGADVILPESSAALANPTSLSIRALGWQAPVEIHKLTKLTNLDLEHCRFARVPEGMAGMDAVTTVFLGGQSAVEFTQLLLVVARMRNVTELQLATHEIPEEIGLCRQIQVLTVWGARQIPAGIGKLKQLKQLVLSIGDFAALPEAVGELTNLTLLNVSENSSLCTLPDSLGNLTQLENLFLNENPRLTQLPESAGRLKALKSVRLSDPETVAGVPASWRAFLSSD